MNKKCFLAKQLRIFFSTFFLTKAVYAVAEREPVEEVGEESTTVLYLNVHHLRTTLRFYFNAYTS